MYKKIIKKIIFISMFFEKMINYLKMYKSTIIIFLSIFLGISVGIAFGEKAKIFMPLGEIFINLTFTIVIPLIFFSVSSSIANIITLRTTKKTLISSIFVFLMMSFVATIFMLISVKLFHPIHNPDINLPNVANIEKVNIFENFASIFTVSDFNKILSKDAILPLIIFSGLLGLAVKFLGKKGEIVKDALNSCASVMYKMIDFLMYYAPVGLFACFAGFFGNSSKNLIDPIMKTVAIFYITAIIFLLLFYTFYTYLSAGNEGIKSMKYLLIPTTTAFATQSSLAALPSSLEAAEKINIPKSVSNLTLPLGSIIHLDGSSMGVVLKIAFLFSIFNIPMTGSDFYFGIFLFAIFISLLSSGIPGGGLILETSIITFYNISAESLPLLILLNYLIDPMITLLNATGNVVATMLTTRIVKGKGWIYRKELEEDTVLKIYK